MKKFFFIIFVIIPWTFYGNIYFKHLGKADGLSQISVISIAQDELGQMWFGTLEGLNCYDGQRMKVYKPSAFGEPTFIKNSINNIVCDQNGSVFFTSDSLLIRYDLQEEEFFCLFHRASCLYSKGENVLMANNDTIYRWDRSLAKFTYLSHLGGSESITSLLISSKQELWVGTTRGLYNYKSISDTSAACKIPNVNIYSLYEDSKQWLWIASFRQGMCKIRIDDNGEVVEQEYISLSNNDVRCFVEDDRGDIWVGTFYGLNRIDGKTGKISSFYKTNIPGSLKHSSVFSLYKDFQGTIWVGTFYGGVHFFNPKMDIFKHYSESGNLNGPSFSFIGDMVEDNNGKIWICTEGGGMNCWDRKRNLFERYLSGTSSFQNLKCIEYDRIREQLYIGTHKQGFLIFDINTHDVNHFIDYGRYGSSISEVVLHGDSLFLLSERGLFVKYDGGNDLYRPYPNIKETYLGGGAMLIDSSDNLWLALKNQIVRIGMNSGCKSVYPLGKFGFGQFAVTKMAENFKKDIFFATLGGGLYRYKPEDNRFIYYDVAGIRYIYNIVCHESGYLILSTDQGVVYFNPYTSDIKVLDVEKQLHLSTVNEGCGLLIDKDGEVIVGGVDGLTTWHFSSLLMPTIEYKLYFSSFKVNGKNFVPVMDNGKRVSLPFVSEIRLSHTENNISISFTSNSYIDSQSKITYEYKLENFERDWNIAYNNTLIYTNLDPGKYRLIVREKTLGSSSDIKSVALSIIICPPWWNTWWAWSSYILLLLIISFWLVRNFRIKMRLRASLLKEQLEKKKNEEIMQSKLQFFANVSHEFRTPLTLIISQLETLLQTSALSPNLRVRLQKIYKNTSLFRELISELLDFRKMERGKLKLHVSQFDIVACLRQVCELFQYQAQIQHVNMLFTANEDVLLVWGDVCQLRKVFSNLLSNALKYTSSGLKIEIVVLNAEDHVEIKVIDGGKGIPQESIPFIFDRFYQVNSNASSAGSGIGLALAKGIVDLHHGTIGVRSAVGYGSIFTVTLPSANVFLYDNNVIWDDSEVLQHDNGCLLNANEVFVEEEHFEVEQQKENIDSEFNKSTILLVEDNEDLLEVLSDILSPFYRIIFAFDGKSGYDKAVEETPDLIISDVMMPIVSGIEMCSRIKNNFDLCHIPVILLTALTSDNNKIEGLQCGADDYIEKPFSNRLLLAHVSSILRNRNLLKKKFGKKDIDAPVEDNTLGLALASMDVDFLNKLDSVVKCHISDADFCVDQLASELGISRTSLYNKLRALCSITPNEFILNARLKMAAKLLLENGDMQILEIAYLVGFNSLSYFRRCFKMHFNLTPQEFRRTHLKV